MIDGRLRGGYGFLGHTAATFVTLYALVIAFAFPFADLAKMRKLQQQTSAAARLSAYRFVGHFLWISAAIAILTAPPRSLLMVPRSPDDFGWLYAHPWALGLSMLLVALLLALIVAPGVQCIWKKKAREKWPDRIVIDEVPLTHAPQSYQIFLTGITGVHSSMIASGDSANGRTEVHGE